MITTTTLAEAQKHFMSAFLHYTSPATRVGGPDPESPAWTPDTEAYNKTKSTTSSYHLSEQRDRCILRQQWNPTVEDLCNTLYHCNASRVEIVSNDREADIFFEAFQQYNFLTETKVGVGYLFQHPEMPKKVLVKGFGVFQCGSDHNGMLVVSQTVDGPIGQATNGQFLRVYTEALELWSSPVC
jgi:5-methylcytosine-specific restriction endonuclease McrBC GTP-binding regulatory subunit McrB